MKHDTKPLCVFLGFLLAIPAATQGLVALKALGLKPKYDPLPVFDSVLKEDYKKMPLYMTSFFPLGYLTQGEKIPPEADRKIRALMVQAADGYIGEHVASTFHAV